MTKIGNNRPITKSTLFSRFQILQCEGFFSYKGLFQRPAKDMLEVTKESLEESRKSSWGKIILEANRDIFFNDRMYRVRKAIDWKKPILSANGGECTEQDIEDYIGYFEMLYGMMTSHIVDEDIVSDNFGGYVELAYINKEIRDYIEDLRRELNNEELYAGFCKWGKGELPNLKN